MSYEEAQQLAQTIKEQFSHVEIDVVQSGVRANAWFIAVRRREVPPESQALIIYNEDEWEHILIALAILCK